jgi:hypothetical protein
MGNLFRNIFSWLSDLYGYELYDYLKGWNCESESFSNPNLFAKIGWITIGIALLMMIIYYYVINHPRFNRWWSWTIMLVLTGVASLLYGYGKTYSDFNGGKIGDCMMYEYSYDQNGNITESIQKIYNSDCWGFGFANLLVGISLFIILSFAFKWWSRNCKRSPLF